MNKLLFLILFCACNLFLYAQPSIKSIQVENVKLGECLDKTTKDRYEIFSYYDSYNSTENCFLLEFFHKDILVNSSCSNINVEITCSNDTVFIRETEIKSETNTDEKCLRDLSYQIRVGSHHALVLVLISDVSSIPYQVFYAGSNECVYPVTEKSDYQYKPFIMDGSCEWIINKIYGIDGYKFDAGDVAHFTDEYTSSGHLYLVRLLGKDVKERNELITRLAEAGVATNVHFKPLPMHTAYKNMGFDIKDFPHSYNMYRNEITLPLHTCLTDEQVEYVIEQFNRMK